MIHNSLEDSNNHFFVVWSRLAGTTLALSNQENVYISSLAALTPPPPLTAQILQEGPGDLCFPQSKISCLISASFK